MIVLKKLEEECHGISKSIWKSTEILHVTIDIPHTIDHPPPYAKVSLHNYTLSTFLHIFHITEQLPYYLIPSKLRHNSHIIAEPPHYCKHITFRVFTFQFKLTILIYTSETVTQITSINLYLNIILYAAAR